MAGSPCRRTPRSSGPSPSPPPRRVARPADRRSRRAPRSTCSALRGPRPARSSPRRSTSRSPSSGRCGTSRTAPSPTARSARSSSPRRPAGGSFRRPCFAMDRLDRAWSSSGSTPTTRSTPGSWSRPATGGCGRWRSSTPSSTTPTARAVTSCRSADPGRPHLPALRRGSRRLLLGRSEAPDGPVGLARPPIAPLELEVLERLRTGLAGALGDGLARAARRGRARGDPRASRGPARDRSLPRAVARLAGRALAAVLTGTNGHVSGRRRLVRRGSGPYPSDRGTVSPLRSGVPARTQCRSGSRPIRPRGPSRDRGGDARLGDIIELERQLHVSSGHLAPLDGSAPVPDPPPA